MAKQKSQSCEEIAKSLICNSCEIVDKEIVKKLDSIPKNRSCKYSELPERVWCKELKKPALYRVCEACLTYHPTYIHCH